MQQHLLLVEDESRIRKGLEWYLAEAGYRVTSAADGVEAFEKVVGLFACNDFIDLIITDVEMPGMRGSELLDKLRETDIIIPVIGISGYSEIRITEEMTERGCIEFLYKPFSPDKLLETVRKVLDR